MSGKNVGTKVIIKHGIFSSISDYIQAVVFFCKANRISEVFLTDEEVFEARYSQGPWVQFSDKSLVYIFKRLFVCVFFLGGRAVESIYPWSLRKNKSFLEPEPRGAVLFCWSQSRNNQLFSAPTPRLQIVPCESNFKILDLKNILDFPQKIFFCIISCCNVAASNQK